MLAKGPREKYLEIPVGERLLPRLPVAGDHGGRESWPVGVALERQELTGEDAPIAVPQALQLQNRILKTENHHSSDMVFATPSHTWRFKNCHYVWLRDGIATLPSR